MAVFSTYSDTTDFLNYSAYSMDTASLLGGYTTLSNGVSAGALSLPLNAVTGTFANGQPVWILDGANSEVVTATGTVSGNALPVTALAAAHGANASMSSPGTNGCLAASIAAASRMVEQICNQRSPGGQDASLFSASRTETYSLATMRAHVSREYQLEVRPYHFPVQSLTSASIQADTVAGNVVDLTNLVLPEGANLIVVPEMGFVGAQSTRALWPSPGLRQPNLWLTLTYTAGPITGSGTTAVPWDIKQATYWLTMHILGYRLNPSGAANVHQGDTSREFRLRGEIGGKAKSLLESDAAQLLMPYRAGFA